MVHHPLRLRLNGEALVSNWRWLRERSGGAACGAAVKADGYGLGALAVVERLSAAGCRDFFVSTWAEAEALMPWDAALTLSVLHGVGPDDLAAALSSPARPVLNTAGQAARWRESGQGRPCDVMVDTGMNRLGLSPAEARAGLLDGLNIETLMSHLACADEPGALMNENQLAAFRELRGQVSARRYSLANSAGICLGADYAFDLTRPGLALYGGLPVPTISERQEGLRAVAAIEAQVIQVRTVAAGDTVGYGATFRASVDTRVAILNIGYADGYLRQLGPVTSGSAGGRNLPVLGRISMDLLALGLPGPRPLFSDPFGYDDRAEVAFSDAVDVGEGDWIPLHFDLPQLARATNLTQYELLTTLGRRYERLWR